MPVIKVAPEYRRGELPPELSWGFHFHFHKLIKKPFHFVKHTIKVAKHHKKLVIGAALIGAGAYAYHAGWLGKTGIGKTLVGHKVGHTVGKVASAVHKISLLHTAKKLFHEAGHFLTSPAVLTTAAIATGSKICTGKNCYGIEPVQAYPQQSYPQQDYPYYTDNGTSPYYTELYPEPYSPSLPPPTSKGSSQAHRQKGSSLQEAGIGSSLSFLKNPYILAGLAVGTLLMLSRRK